MTSANLHRTICASCGSSHAYSLMPIWTVSRRSAGERLVNFVQTQLGDDWSRRKVKQAIDRYRCRVNGKVHSYASYSIVAGDVVDFECDEGDLILARDWFLEADRVLFDDEAILIFDKPAGVVCDDEKLIERLHQHWPDADIVHRLDKMTTGVWMVAKTPEASEGFKAAFKRRTIEKTYWVVVDGVPKQESGKVDLPIRRIAGAQQNEWRAEKHPDARKAATEWTLDRSGAGMSLVVCHPLTGRTHQIRLHLRAMGHPVLGDYRYSPQFRCSYRAPRCLLHALRVAFDHPITGTRIAVEAPVPDDMKQAVVVMEGEVT